MRLYATAFLAVAATVCAAVAAEPAAAGLTGVQLVGASSAQDSSNKSATVTCPAGKQVIGAGADTSVFSPSPASLILDDIAPNPTLTNVTASAVESGAGTTVNWSVTALALCAPPPPGLVLNSGPTPDNSSNKSVTVPCPTGKRLLGTGYNTNGGTGAVLIDDLRPNPELTGVTAQALETEGGTGANWNVRVYAICSNPIGGLERVSATSALNSSNKFAQTDCPGGKVATGMGYDTNAGNGEVMIHSARWYTGNGKPAGASASGQEDTTGAAGPWNVTSYAICTDLWRRQAIQSPTNSSNKSAAFGCHSAPPGDRLFGLGGELTGGNGQVLIDDLRPDSALLGFTGQGVEDGNGTANNWSLTVYAVCGSGLPGLERVSAGSTLDSSNKSVTATCPAGKKVVGSGFDTNAGNGQVVIDDVRPDAALSGVTVQGLEIGSDFTNPWGITAYAVCATPPAGLERVASSSPLTSSTKSVTATCPAGKNLIGLGSDINAGVGKVGLDDIIPDAGLTQVTVTGNELESGNPNVWSVTAYAICALP
jgi:hypothetical protein